MFAEDSIGPLEAPLVLPLLLPGLQRLCLNSNPIGDEGFSALTEAVKAGKTSPLGHGHGGRLLLFHSVCFFTSESACVDASGVWAGEGPGRRNNFGCWKGRTVEA
mmetsp:Transcript_29430/g.57772  ORF Transcript_29430/g.57772 Transcript_29430/m.57772 type:complete len:105 (+) Transcript_29430:432-746(+)